MARTLARICHGVSNQSCEEFVTADAAAAFVSGYRAAIADLTACLEPEKAAMFAALLDEMYEVTTVLS